MEELGVLMALAKRGRGIVKICTGELASELGISQQSVSRKLQELEAAGLIERNASPSGIQAKITPKGLGLLEKQYSMLKSIVEKKQQPILTGTVISGMGEGKYYIGMRQYREGIKQKLGFDPYAGTLNVRLANPQDSYRIEETKPTIIDGFTTDSRTYGAIRSFPVLISGSVKGAILRPERTHYGLEIIELIAQPFLRKKLGLKDGDRIKIEVLE